MSALLYPWNDPTLVLPRVTCKGTEAYPSSIPVLCAYTNKRFQVCLLLYDEDSDKIMWLEDNSERWNVTKHVVAWSFIPEFD